MIAHSLAAAIRRAWQPPAFAVAATATLAVGFAAPTALFAVLDATVLRPLPYANADSVYALGTRFTDGRFTVGLLASEELGALHRAEPDVEGALLVQNATGLDIGGEMHQISAVTVSENFWSLFGVPMLAGRPFVADDYAATGTQASPNSMPRAIPIVISAHLWHAAFGADSKVLKTPIRVGPFSTRVVGVAPPDFDIPHGADLWVPVHWAETINHGFEAYVRLPAGTTPDALARRLGPMWTALGDKYPDQERNRAFVLRPLLDSVVGDLGPVVVIAFAATGVLFLLALVNVINLYLARAASRAREIAMRTVLGATRGRLVRQLVGDSLILSVSAAAVGVPLAYVAVHVVVVLGGSAMPRVDGMAVSPRVLLLTLLLVVVAGVVVGLAPLLTVARPNLGALANDGGRSGTAGRATHRLLGLMIVAEVMLAVTLVAGAGRLLLSLSHRLAIDPGFVTDGRLAVDVLLPTQTQEQTAEWWRSAEAALHGVGVKEVAMTSTLPLRHEWDSTTFTDVVGHPTDPGHRPNARYRNVSPNFFHVMGIPILAGRAFTSDDRPDGDPVLIVNEAWVKKFLADLDPLRQRITGVPGQKRPAAIVGVVGDVSYSDLTQAAEPTVYLSMGQHAIDHPTFVLTAVDGHPDKHASAIRAALARIDARAPIEMETVAHAVDRALVWPELGLLLMGTLGTSALLLASIGVFGVVAFVTTERRSEMAVRVALGAQAAHLIGLVVGQAARLALVGATAGLLLAWWIGRFMTRYLYEVSAGNPVVLTSSTIIVVLVALAATLPSARRAARTDPIAELHR
jgi:putative ABC transport system permease protein